MLLSSTWEYILRLNGETGMVEMPGGVWAMGGFDLITENISRGNAPVEPQTLQRLFWREREGSDVGVGEGVRQVYGVQLVGDAAPRELWAFEMRKISHLDEDLRHKFA